MDFGADRVHAASPRRAEAAAELSLEGLASVEKNRGAQVLYKSLRPRLSDRLCAAEKASSLRGLTCGFCWRTAKGLMTGQLDACRGGPAAAQWHDRCEVPLHAHSARSEARLTLQLAGLLKSERDAIVTRFVAEVRGLTPPPTGVSYSRLVDHIPSFLDEIAAEVARETHSHPSLDAGDTSKAARQHGVQRWALGYDLQGLIREYGILRYCILQAAKDARVPLAIDDFDLLAKCLNVGVAEAANAYIAFRDEQLKAQRSRVEFLAEAGELLTSSLDYRSTLRRLTNLVVPRLADWCAVHVDGDSADEMPLAHTEPAKVTLLRDLYRSYPPPPDSPYGYPHVLRTGEPQLIEEVRPELLTVAAQNGEHLALLKAVGTCSWIVVPLRIQGKIFGALTLAYSGSQRHYSDVDLALASELARRAAVAIDNAKLYAMSQRERSRVEAATRAKDDFVAMVSHELRTPLNAIMGWLRLMKMGALSEEKRQHALEVIERNAQAQSQIVADLLDISRAITGKLRINATQIDLTNVVELAIEGVRPAAEAKRLQIEADLAAGATVIRGDADRLQQVAWNLLTNAVKFTPKGGRIRVRLRRIESDVELVVADDGQGIEPAFLPLVFDGFRQAEPVSSREHGGLGIGLSIAKHLVELHGGSIHAQSVGAGQGATFVVRLPVSPLVSTTLGVTRIRATLESKDDSPLSSQLDGVRVLVVDDEPDAREIVAYVLETCGANVHTAGSVAEALAELEPFVPHVVVSDIGMPKEDGYSLIRSIRTAASEATRTLPAIALTAFARNEDRSRALVEGFNLHLEKPVEPAQLVRAVVELTGDIPHSARREREATSGRGGTAPSGSARE